MSTDWTPARRVAFRFGVVYLTLFSLATQISGSLLPNPWFTYRGLGRISPMREVTHWVARTFVGVDVRLDDVSGGVGNWVGITLVIPYSMRDAASDTRTARRHQGSHVA